MRFLAVAFAGAMTLLAGCSEKAINVADAEVTPDETMATLTDNADEERAVYYQDDESVRLAVRFDVNFVAVYKSYYAWWYFPNGRVYLRQPVRNEFGSHLSLVTSMGIRDQPPAGWPGRWKVRLTLRNRLLIEHEFEIREGTRAAAIERASEPDAPPDEASVAMVAPSLETPDAPAVPTRGPPLCPDPGSPAGWCNWEAPEEGRDGATTPTRVTVAPAPSPAPIAPPPPAERAASGIAPALEPGTDDADRSPPPAAIDLSNAAWIPLPFDPSRFAPPARPAERLPEE